MSVAIATKHEQALRSVKAPYKKLLKQQLKAMRNHVEKQSLELEKLRARHKETISVFMRKKKWYTSENER